MDEQENIPRRSKFWFSGSKSSERRLEFFDNITIVFSAALFLFSFALFWPIVSKFQWEEAFFTPLMPSIITWFGALNVDPSTVLRIMFILSFATATLGVYFLARELSMRQITPILSSVLYIVPSIPIFVMLYFQRGLYEWELVSAQSFFSIVYGDVAHFLALSLIPISLIFFLRFVKNGFRQDLLLCLLPTLLVLMANRSQGFYLFVGFLIVTLTEIFLGMVRVKIKRGITVIVLSLGLASFWYTPFFLLQSFRLLAERLSSNLKFLFPLPFVISVVALILSFVFFARRRERQGIFVSFLLFTVFLVLTLDWLVNGRSFLVHPNRVIPNLYLFASITLAIGLTWIIDQLQLVGRFAFEAWRPALKIVGSLVFGLVSFAVLVVAAYILAPLAISAVSGPDGIWPKIKYQADIDKQESLRLVGANFGFRASELAPWQIGLSIAVTLIFLVLIIWLVRKKDEFS